MNKIKKAIIPVAGLGTRMLPATKAIPKQLLPIIDKPLIQYVVEEAIEAGIREIIFVTRSGKEAIENHFDANYELEHRLESLGKRSILKSVKNLVPKGIKISSIRQENALGLGHAILCAKHLINKEDFAVLLPDEILIQKNRVNDLSKMLENYHKTSLGQILVEKISKSELKKYGVVDVDNQSLKSNSQLLIKRLVEKPTARQAPSNLRVVGRYILLNEILSFIGKTKADNNGEIQLTSSIDKYIRKNNDSVEAILTNSEIFDCGSRKGFIGANIALSLKDKELKKYIKELLNRSPGGGIGRHKGLKIPR